MPVRERTVGLPLWEPSGPLRVLSGGTEGVLSPHYTVFGVDPDAPPGNGRDARLALGVAMTAVTPADANGRAAHARQVAAGVRAAMCSAGIDDARDVAHRKKAQA